MKTSYKWLSELLDLGGLTPESLAERLTYAGHEVDAVSRLAKASNLVIGEIKTCVPHPDSDHLHVLQVDEGPKYGVHQIVCGAPNAREGLKVIVAREGATLPEVEIRRSVIRGVESDGMCCSLAELGIDRKFLSERQLAGIEELPSNAPVGEENVLAYLGLDDAILEIELLANRGDLLSMEGLAYEVGAILGKSPKIEKEAQIPVGNDEISLLSVTAKAPSFHGLIASDVVDGPSPKWMRERLLSSGVRPLSFLVDVGNYAMLLTGQPVNMYDADKVTGAELRIVDDYEGVFEAFDGKAYRIEKGDLAVLDGKGDIVSLAGIMAAKKAAVTSSTKRVLVESALFSGAAIRRTSARLGLSSESSSRFVKGVSIDAQEKAVSLIARLLKEVGKASRVSSLKPYDVTDKTPQTIACSVHYINNRLGSSFGKEEINEVLSRDHLALSWRGEDAFEAVTPLRRMDLKGPEDLAEEVIRLLGYDRLESRYPALGSLSDAGLSDRQKAIRSLRSYLRHRGLSETLTYTLRPKNEKASFADFGAKTPYALLNPLTEERSQTRTALLPSLIETAKYNLDRQVGDLAFFELSDLSSVEGNMTHLAAVLVGSSPLEGGYRTRPYSFYAAKGLFEGILDLVGISPSRLKKAITEGGEWHPYRAEKALLGKETVAVYGELHPSYMEGLGLPKTPFAALEIDLNALLSLRSSAPKAPIPPRFPSVSRDISALFPAKTPYEEIKKALLKSSPLIEGCALFDLYSGKGVKDGWKSLGLRLTLRKEGGTLLDAEIEDAVQKAKGALLTSFGAELR